MVHMIFEMKWGAWSGYTMISSKEGTRKEVDRNVSSSTYCGSDNWSDEEVEIHRIIEMMAGRGCGIL